LDLADMLCRLIACENFGLGEGTANGD